MLNFFTIKYCISKQYWNWPHVPGYQYNNSFFFAEYTTLFKRFPFGLNSVIVNCSDEQLIGGETGALSAIERKLEIVPTKASFVCRDLPTLLNRIEGDRVLLFYNFNLASVAG